MSAGKFTPGPWFWRGNQLRTRAAMGRRDSPTGWLVPCEGLIPSMATPESEANRALIIAGPALHAALREIVAALDERGDDGALANKARDALALAKAKVQS